MKIKELSVKQDWVLGVLFDDGKSGEFDVSPYLELEAFEELKDSTQFQKVKNGGYYIEWECGADLSADTIEARLKTTGAL